MEVDSKINSLTLYLYNLMVENGEKRNFKKIRYYLFFLKYIDNNIFDDDYIQTKTNILWNTQESLMIFLIFKPVNKIPYNDDISEKEMNLCNGIYEILGSFSTNILRDISFSIINKERKCDNKKLVKSICDSLNDFKKQYENNAKVNMKYLNY